MRKECINENSMYRILFSTSRHYSPEKHLIRQKHSVFSKSESSFDGSISPRI